ncbi:MAG: ATP-binding protein [Nitrospiria bacterium]
MIESIKALIVDDEPDDAFLTRRCIKKGFPETTLAIDHAINLTEVESLIENQKYDLMFIDYHLGEHTGLEVMRLFREQGLKCPIILLTGQGDEEIAVAAMKEGASDYLLKRKLSPEIVFKTMNHALELYQTEHRRKRTEKALKRSEEKYRTIINTTTEGFWMFDLKLKTIDLNASLCRMLGYQREEVLSKKPEELINERMQDSFLTEMGGIVSSDQQIFETSLLRKNGDTLAVLFNATTVRSRKGFPLQIFAFVTDITKLKEAEETLKKGNEALRKIDHMKSEFVSNVSHELRTPLTSIKNAVSILVRGKAGLFNQDQERFLKMASRNINRLAELVNDILDLSKLESGKLEMHFSEVKLNTLIENMINIFQAQAEEKGITLKATPHPSVPAVYADPKRMEQILCNLLSNALKFTPGGGAVSLFLEETGGEVTIRVTDTGIGLSSEDQARVFDRFYQAGDSLEQTVKGTGLGLSIARELVEIQGGRISVESKISQGCRFSFTIPCFTKQAVEMAALESEIREIRDHAVFSMFLVKLRPEGPSVKVSIDERLRRATEFIRKALPRDSDFIIAQPAFERMLCLLPGTTKVGAMTVKERLERLFFLNKVFLKEVQLSVPSIMGPVTYPEEGETGKDLVSRATESYEEDRRGNEQTKSAYRR